MIRRGTGGESSLCVVPAKSIHTDSCVSCRRGTARLRHVIRLSSAVGMRRPHLSSVELQARGSRSEHVGSELRAWGTRSTLACGGRADGSPNYFADLRLDVWHARACVRLSHAEEGKWAPKRLSGEPIGTACRTSERRGGARFSACACPSPPPVRTRGDGGGGGGAAHGCIPVPRPFLLPRRRPILRRLRLGVAPPMAKSERREISQSRRWSALAKIRYAQQRLNQHAYGCTNHTARSRS